MSILFPGSPLEMGNRKIAYDNGVPGLLFGSDTISDCNKVTFFGQLRDVDIEYAGLAQTLRSTPAGPQMVARSTQQDAIGVAIATYISSSYHYGDVFRDVVSPTFTPGGARTIVRETGNYQLYAGQTPSELVFSIKGVDNASLYWARNFMPNIRPMSMGVYLRNNTGDILGLMVGSTVTDTLPTGAITKYAFLPIPILGIRRAATTLGGFENPDLTSFSILFPPNWENPYALGSTLDTIPASLKSISTGLGRIQWSTLCLVPQSLVGEYSQDIG